MDTLTSMKKERVELLKRPKLKIIFGLLWELNIFFNFIKSKTNLNIY